MDATTVNTSSNRLTQLPNGDLWRGAVAEAPTTNVEAPVDAARTAAMDAIVASAKGANELTCLWCGHQLPASAYNEMQKHVETQHPIASAPPADVDKLAAALAAAPAAAPKRK